MKPWDVFISHATEDKQEVALPLTEALRRRGARVWLDKFQLQIGDDLLGKIDQGLANCRFGVVVLSPSFFSKSWTRDELGGLQARHIVLPVWHHLSADQVLAASPIMAGKFAARWEDGVDAVADQIVRKLFSVDDITGKGTTQIALEFAQLLAKGPAERAHEFLDQQRAVLTAALRVGDNDYLRTGVQLDGLLIDACAATYQATARTYMDWHLLFFGDPADPLLGNDGKSTGSLAALLHRAEKLKAFVAANFMEARAVLPGIKQTFAAVVVAGRRPQPDSLTGTFLDNLNDNMDGVRVRTYDWLLDAVLKIEPGARSTESSCK